MQTEVEELRRRPEPSEKWIGWLITPSGVLLMEQASSQEDAVAEVVARIVRHGVLVIRGEAVDRLEPWLREIQAPRVDGLRCALAAGSLVQSVDGLARLRIAVTEILLHQAVDPTPPDRVVLGMMRSDLGLPANATASDIRGAVRALIQRSEDLDNLRVTLRDALGGNLDDASDSELVDLVELLDPTNAAALLARLRELIDGAERLQALLEGAVPRELQ